MKLYHSQFTRSGRARWMLEEVGAPYELERITFAKGEHRTPEYLAVHPHGSVPALVDGDLKLIESSAIVMHLADKFPEKKLAPALGTNDRAHYYRWMVYVPATVDPVLEAITMHTRILPEAMRVAAIAEEGKRKLGSVVRVLEEAVGGRDHVLGDGFTAADVILGSAIGWIGFLGMLPDHPTLAAYHKGLSARPAYQRAHAD
jgi:glutathione S-transferase